MPVCLVFLSTVRGEWLVCGSDDRFAHNRDDVAKQKKEDRKR